MLLSNLAQQCEGSIQDSAVIPAFYYQRIFVDIKLVAIVFQRSRRCSVWSPGIDLSLCSHYDLSLPTAALHTHNSRLMLQHTLPSGRKFLGS